VACKSVYAGSIPADASCIAVDWPTGGAGAPPRTSHRRLLLGHPGEPLVERLEPCEVDGQVDPGPDRRQRRRIRGDLG
jgi:hypothetical protein